MSRVLCFRQKYTEKTSILVILYLNYIEKKIAQS